MSLAAQLIRAYDLRDAKEAAEPVLSEAASSRADFLRGLLSDAAERLRDGGKLVLVVDALDEAGTRPGENVLGLPQVLPAGVFVVASKRPVPVDLYTESPRRVVRIDPDSDGNRQDVRAYLTAAAPEALAEAIVAKKGEQAADAAIERFGAAAWKRAQALWGSCARRWRRRRPRARPPRTSRRRPTTSSPGRRSSSSCASWSPTIRISRPSSRRCSRTAAAPGSWPTTAQSSWSPTAAVWPPAAT
jgi:hypothetical protein